MEFTKSYFRDEIVRFWKMTGDKRYSVEEMDGAFEGLCYCYLHTKGVQKGDCLTAFEVAANNWQRVRLYRVLGM